MPDDDDGHANDGQNEANRYNIIFIIIFIIIYYYILPCSLVALDIYFHYSNIIHISILENV